MTADQLTRQAIIQVATEEMEREIPQQTIVRTCRNWLRHLAQDDGDPHFIPAGERA